MIKVRFSNNYEDSLFKYAVIIARKENEWIFCRHKDRTTLEFPGGKRELNETIKETAKRELKEETGAVEYSLFPITGYSVESDGTISYGMLYEALVDKLMPLQDSEIAEITIRKDLPEYWTYPDIQPHLLEYYWKWKRNVSRETF